MNMIYIFWWNTWVTLPDLKNFSLIFLKKNHVYIKSLLWVQILVLTELKTFGFVKEKSCAGHVKRIWWIDCLPSESESWIVSGDKKNETLRNIKSTGWSSEKRAVSLLKLTVNLKSSRKLTLYVPKHDLEVLCDFRDDEWRWLFHQSTVDTKKWFFRPPVMSFGFFYEIFGGKGLEIDTYKPPNFIWSYHTHMANTCWPKWPREPKLTFLSNFDVKNSIKSS